MILSKKAPGIPGQEDMQRYDIVKRAYGPFYFLYGARTFMYSFSRYS